MIEDYLWLIEALTVISIFLPIASLMLNPLAMLYGLIADKLIP